MKDKTGFFAALSDSLCCVCVYWVVASTMVMAGRGWTLGLLWPLLWTALCALVFAHVLEKPRGFNALFAMAVGAAALALVLFILLAGVRMTALHVFTLSVGAGMAAGLPVYYLVKRPTVHGHLTCLDVLLLAFAWMLLTQSGKGVQTGAALPMALVLVLAVGTAVGLRMGSGGGAEAAKAIGVALAAAAALALGVLGMIMLFSRSGALTGSIVSAVGGAFGAVGDGLTALAARFASLFKPLDTETVAVPVENAATQFYSAQAAAETGGTMAPWVKFAAAALILAAVAAALYILRKTTLVIDAQTSADGPDVYTGSLRASARGRWAAWMRALRFRVQAFVRRDTPAGVLVYAERRAKRRGRARQPGETARQFLRRAAPDGTLDTLADELDRRWYGGGNYTLTAAQCRALRQKIKEEASRW